MTTSRDEGRTEAGQGIEAHPALLLQRLLRFDTSNPPGREAACVDDVESLLRTAGVPTRRFEDVPGRPNLIALSRCMVLSVKDNVIEIDESDAFPDTPVRDLKS